MWKKVVQNAAPHVTLGLDIHMENPLMWISKFWIEFEALLLEAVQRNCQSALVHLLDYEERLYSTELVPKTEHFGREKDSSHALILAARNGNYQLIKLFLDKQYSIAFPHHLDCSCLKCQDNKLGQSKKRLEALQALSNPLYISLTSEDPFLTAFKLCACARKFGEQDDCFESNYQELADANQTFCLGLLDEVESEKEGCCLMAQKKVCEYVQKESDLHCDNVAFIQIAIEYRQKDVVAHSISQHFITSIVFDNIPKWRTSSMKYKIFFIFVATLLYPITSFASIVAPCSSAGQLAKRPLVKFVNVGASFITFLFLLACMASTKRNRGDHIDGIMNGGPPKQIEIAVFVWLVGLIVGEVQQLLDSGVAKYFSSGWNFIDISMMTLMSTSYLTWTILYFMKVDPKVPMYRDAYELVDGLFALAMILSSFRLVYLMQISSYLGLLQLCLSQMIQVIFQFGFISIVVLFAFSVAMAYLSQSSDDYHNYLAGKYPSIYNSTNTTWVRLILNVSYDGLPSSMVTLIWGALNMVNLKSLDGLDDGSFIHMFSYLLFGLYYCATMIVLLNMLIAMMSNSYQYIQENLDVEHKYSRTLLWVDYIGEENSRAIPFNLVPSFNTMKKISARICGGTKNLIKRHNDIKRNLKPELNKAAHDKYKNLCAVLVERYLVKKHGFNYKEEVQERRSDNAQFLQKVKLQCSMWTSKYQQFTDAVDSGMCDSSSVCDVDTSPNQISSFGCCDSLS